MTPGRDVGLEEVRLRQWKDSDLARFAELNADPEVMRHFPRASTYAESKAAMDRVRAVIEKRGWGLWALEVDGAFAGFTGLAKPNFTSHFTPCVEIAWRMRREYWGRGLAFRAARIAEDYAFNELKLPRLVSFTAVQNVRSRRLMERLGFHQREEEDFNHPQLPADCHVLRHVLYRKNNPSQ